MGAAAAGAAVALALAAPASAQDGHFPAAGWEMRGFDHDSRIVDATTLELTKLESGSDTWLETTDLGLAVSPGDVISMDYEMLDGAAAGNGGIRLFVFDFPNADVLIEEPPRSWASP